MLRGSARMITLSHYKMSLFSKGLGSKSLLPPLRNVAWIPFHMVSWQAAFRSFWPKSGSDVFRFTVCLFRVDVATGFLHAC